jgi:uncharacterized Zn-binding protein involved in type VI secretion
MPAATRIGDTDITHCSTPARAQGASKVFVNGIPWSCQGHTNTPHLIPNDDPCSVHAASISSGSSTVKVQGRGAGRVGDSISGCTAVASGSGNVFAGG